MRASLLVKLVILGVVFTLLPTVIIVFNVHYQSRGAERVVVSRADEFARTDMKHILEGVYSLCETQHEILSSFMVRSLEVAKEVLENTGGLSVDSSVSVSWEARNQFSGEVKSVSLPGMRIGGRLIQPNDDPNKESPVVDKVKRLQGVTCTIFQRMNDDGDMLRICTNVLGKDGKRAIGTYIPAKEPDGTPNVVVSTVLKGERYAGRAFVVDRWYITAYEPLKDKNGNILGMIYTGIPQESATALRKAIMDIKIGKTGYVFVFNAKGVNKGYCVLSYKGTRDGRNEWETKDADGKLFVQEIIEKALSLKGKEVGEVYYRWKNQDDPKPRQKIALVSYYEPWDWVIAASAYVDELQEVQDDLRKVFTGLLRDIFFISLVVVIIAVVCWYLVARGIVKKLLEISSQVMETSRQVESASGQLAESSQQMSSDVSTQASSLEETSASMEEMSARVQETAMNSQEAVSRIKEVQSVAGESALAVGELNTAMEEISKASEQTTQIIKTIENIAFQTNLLALNAAVEAARAGEAGRGFAVVAEEVRNLAQRSAKAARETADILSSTGASVKRGVEVVGRVTVSIRSIVETLEKAVALVSEVSTASLEQSQGIEQVNMAIASINQVTQSVSAASEESASTAEELSALAVQLKQLADSLYELVSGGKGE